MPRTGLEGSGHRKALETRNACQSGKMPKKKTERYGTEKNNIDARTDSFKASSMAFALTSLILFPKRLQRK